jgi:hypothetical protein
MADMMLDRQYFNVNDPRPYDDVGWTLGPLYNVKTVRIDDVAVLDAPMTLVKGEVAAPGGITRLGKGPVQAYLINHNADNALATFRFKQKELKIHAAEKDFEVLGKKFRAGTFIVKPGENPGSLEGTLDAAGKFHGLAVFAVPSLPDLPTHELVVPRVALVHTWQNTQTEGWVRIALDECGIPHDYVSVHVLRDTAKLRDKYDVILFGPSSPDPFSLLNGVAGDKPLPWKKTELTPNIGVQDSTDDMRGGIELDGVLHLRDFVRDGGVFVTLTSALPIQFRPGPGAGMRIRRTVGRGGPKAGRRKPAPRIRIRRAHLFRPIARLRHARSGRGGADGRQARRRAGCRAGGRPTIPISRRGGRGTSARRRSKSSARPRKTPRRRRPRRVRGRRWPRQPARGSS